LIVTLLLLVPCLNAGAAQHPRYHPRFPPTRVDGLKYAETRSLGRAYGAPVGMGTYEPSPGVMIGHTYYDLQHLGSTGRQVDHHGTYIQASWMKAPGPTDSIRTVDWSRVSVIGSPEDFILADGDTIRRLPLSVPLLVPPPTFTAVRPGYTNLRNRPGGKGVVTYHDAPLEGGIQFWESRLDRSAGSGVFNPVPSQAPQPPGYDMDAVIWPKQAISTCGSDMIHHAIGTWSGVANECWYWRGVIDDSAGTVSWDPGQPTLIDHEDAFITSVIEAAGDTVYIVVAKYIDAVNADLIYYRSSDCGETWNAPVNVTQFTWQDPEGLYYDLNAVIDDDGELHVIYHTIPADGRDYPTSLYHWSPSTGIRLITTAPWPDDPCPICGVILPSCRTVDLAIADMTLSVKPAGVHGLADELIYAIWTQYGPNDTDRATVDDVGTLFGCLNGEIYWSVSSDNGFTWDRPQNLTGTVTPGCLPGDCASESWVSAAARADSGVYISFVEDRHAGPVIFGKGAWSDNPYRIMAAEARMPNPEPVIAVEPVSFVELHADPVTGHPDTCQISVLAVNNGAITYSIDVTNADGGLAHVQVNGGISYTATVPAGMMDTVTVTFHTSGLPDPSEHHWRLEITSNDPVNDPGQGGSPIDVDLQVFAASTWFACTSDTLTTGLHRLQVSSCLEMGNWLLPGTGFFHWSDSTEWLVSGSPVVARLASGDTLAYHNALLRPADRTRALNRSFRAQSELVVVRDTAIQIADSSYQVDLAYGSASTTDTTIGIDYLVLAPRHAGMQRGALWKFSMRTLTGDTLKDVHFGVVADFDVIDAAGGRGHENAGTGNEPLGWIGVVGGETDDSLNFYPNASFAGLFYVNIAEDCVPTDAIAAQVISNRNYVYPAGSYVPDSLYALLTTFGAAGTWGDNIHIDTGQAFDDVSALLILGHNVDLVPGQPVDWGYGLAVSDVSEADLETTMWSLRMFSENYIDCFCKIEVPGDGNGDGIITTSDIIGLVNYVFKCDCPPLPCYANGDVNCSGSVTSVDIIFLVGHVFKGGIPPCDICNESPLPCH
jgi:hypothetical protein